MSRHIYSAAIAAIAGAATALPAFSGTSDFDAWSVRSGNAAEVHVRLHGAPGELFAVFVGPTNAPLDPVRSSLLHRGRFDPTGSVAFTVPAPNFSSFPPNHAVRLHALTRGTAGLHARSIFLPLTGDGGTLCQEFDPNFSLGPDDPDTGQILSGEWNRVGLTVSATNAVPFHPQVPAIFDSAAPTGGDFDLATPGFGPGNTEPLGKLIIIPENDFDGNMDGLIDEPDDEEFGGVIRFDFADPYRMCNITLVDIDDVNPTELRFYIGSAMTLETIPVPSLGENSVQTLTFDKLDVRRFEVALGGSGAIARIGMVPCPMLVDLDETPFGKPLGLFAGSWITDQFGSVGVEISAMNNVAGHPDKSILFDSANPTGGDFDLMTPGPGINNTTPLGMVLIIAENDVDLNMDGLVDDPDDEEGGGQIIFEFSETVTFFSTLVLDVDGLERDVFTFFDELGNTIEILEINALGENSVQMLTTPTPISGIKRIQANFTGSGALARLRWCPDSNFSGS